MPACAGSSDRRNRGWQSARSALRANLGGPSACSVRTIPFGLFVDSVLGQPEVRWLGQTYFRVELSSGQWLLSWQRQTSHGRLVPLIRGFSSNINHLLPLSPFGLGCEGARDAEIAIVRSKQGRPSCFQPAPPRRIAQSAGWTTPGQCRRPPSLWGCARPSGGACHS